MATLTTQKSLGKRIGKVTAVGRNSITVKTSEPLTPGDGLCYLAPQGQLEGFLVNHVQGNTITPNRMPATLAAGTPLWRNNDQAFEKQLLGNTAERRIPVAVTLEDTPDGLQLTLADTDGCQATAVMACNKETPRDPQRAAEQIERQLSKMGDTAFTATEVTNRCRQPWFLPAAILNQLRRQATQQLEETRIAHHLQHRGHCPTLAERLSNTCPYSLTAVDYRANIINSRAEQFYRRHGVEQLEYGLEKTLDYSGKALMTTRYCIRYELGMCLMGKNKPSTQRNPEPGTATASRHLLLHNNGKWLRLDFDCRNCQMLLSALPPQERPPLSPDTRH